MHSTLVRILTRQKKHIQYVNINEGNAKVGKYVLPISFACNFLFHGLIFSPLTVDLLKFS